MIPLIIFVSTAAIGCFVGGYYQWHAISAEDYLRTRHEPPTEAPKPSSFERFVKPYAGQISHLFPGLRLRMTTARIRQQLVYAGSVPYQLNESLFWGIRLLALLAGFYLGIMVTLVLGFNIIFTGLGGLILGYIWPVRWLSKIAAERQEALDFVVPEMLDLLTIALEAGMGFEPALDLTVRRIRPPLEEEMRRMLIDMRLSVPFVEALEKVIERTDSADLHAFLQSLILAKQLGTPLVDTIIEQSEAINKRRIANVKERVNKVVPRASGVLAVLTVIGMGVMILGLLVLSMLIELGII